MARALKYSNAKFALGICDICGFRFKLTELKATTVRGKKTGLLVCDVDFDPDHPQNFLDKHVATDPQALKNPRPQMDLDASRRLFPTGIWLRGRRPDLSVQEKLVTDQMIKDSNATLESDWEQRRFRWANQRVEQGEDLEP